MPRPSGVMSGSPLGWHGPDGWGTGAGEVRRSWEWQGLGPKHLPSPVRLYWVVAVKTRRSRRVPKSGRGQLFPARGSTTVRRRVSCVVAVAARGSATGCVPDRDPVVVELLQDSSGWLPGELFDMGCAKQISVYARMRNARVSRGGYREPLGDDAGHRAFRNVVPLQERGDARVQVEGRESLQGMGVIPFAGCPAAADRDAVFVQGPQHLLDAGVQFGGDPGGRPFPVHIQVMQQFGV